MRPTDRLRVLFVAHDVAPDLARKVREQREDAAHQQVSFDLGTPELDLIQSGRVGWGEVEGYPRMHLENQGDRLRLVGRQIVHDHVDVASGRLRRDDVTTEPDERVARVPGQGLSKDLASPHIQGGVERQRAVPVVLEAAAFRPGPATWAASGPADPAPGWPASCRRRTPRRVGAESDTAQSRRRPSVRSRYRRRTCTVRARVVEVRRAASNRRFQRVM